MALKLLLVYFSVPPDISVEIIPTPALECSEINITCNTRSGNPSDVKNYIYNWIYKPMYGDSAAYIPVPSGMFLHILHFDILK